MTYVLAVYERGLAYGGPEEGGWYYDTGELVRIVGCVANEDKAYARARRLNAIMRRVQDAGGVRQVSSVLYNGGRYVIGVYEDKAPDHYPERTPHYE